jgi:hypothetical protein
MMIRDIAGQHEGVIQLLSTPRHGPGRRRGVALGVVLAIAVAGGLIGQLSAQRDAAHPIPPGPFGYFPT